MALFGRRVRLEVGPAGAAGVDLGALTIGFRVTHKASREPSTATIRVWNVADSTLELARAPGAAVRLLVGYEPVARLMFTGQPVKDGINLTKQGADRILQLDCDDGGRPFVTTTLVLSYTTPTTIGTVLSQVLAQTAWARGSISIDETIQLPHGVVLAGRPSEILDRLAAMVLPGADWFVRDGALYMVPKGQSTPEVAPQLSSITGNLIGTPTSTKEGVKATALIDATMRPGRAFVIEASQLSGTYVARDVVFTGSSRDGVYYMEITGKPLGVP